MFDCLIFVSSAGTNDLLRRWRFETNIGYGARRKFSVLIPETSRTGGEDPGAICYLQVPHQAVEEEEK
jgi:hypothetical protein